MENIQNTTTQKTPPEWLTDINKDGYIDKQDAAILLNMNDSRGYCETPLLSEAEENELLDYLSAFEAGKVFPEDDVTYSSWLQNNKVGAYDRNYTGTSQIDNRYMNYFCEGLSTFGHKYSVTQNGDIMTLKDENTGEVSTIDFAELTQTISDPKQKERFKAMLQSLPAEVLIDINNESRFYFDNDYEFPGAFVSDRDEIVFRDTLLNEMTAGGIVHETGHAIDWIGKTASNGIKSNGIQDAYRKDMKSYEAAGNTRRASYTDEGDYGTWNLNELFAESYVLCMIGNEGNKQYMLDFFQNTIRKVMEQIDKTRQTRRNVANMTSVENSDGTTTKTAYDKNGAKIRESVLDKNGNLITSYIYDKKGKITEGKSYNSKGELCTSTYTYDKNGNLSLVEEYSSSNKIRTSYSENGSVAYQFNKDLKSEKTTYYIGSYDDKGKLVNSSEITPLQFSRVLLDLNNYSQFSIKERIGLSNLDDINYYKALEYLKSHPSANYNAILNSIYGNAQKPKKSSEKLLLE